MNSILVGHRHLFWSIVVAVVIAMASAYYLQLVVGLTVCPLCLTQRLFFITAGVIALIAAVHNPGRLGRQIYAALGLLVTAGGMAFAGRHIWLQYLPPEEVPACGPSLEYMLETLPFADTFKILLLGDGNCAETLWTLLGLSIPELAMGVFMFIAGVFIALLVRR